MTAESTYTRRRLWLQLMETAELLHDLADQWSWNDPDLEDLERLFSGYPEQLHLPFDRGGPPDDDMPF
jgi:hypothetical protein